MGKFSLENKIKDRLQGHEVHVDKRELWKALGIEEEEKDRKGIWLWWLAGILGLVFIGGMWWYIQGDEIQSQHLHKAAIIEIDENLAKTGNEASNENSMTEKLASIIHEVKTENNTAEKTSNQNTKTPILNQNRNHSNTNPNTNQRQEDVSTIFGPITNNSNSSVNKTLNQASKNLSIGKKSVIASKNVIANQELTIEKLINTTSFLLFDRDLGDLFLDVKPVIKPLPKPRKFEFEIFGGVGTIDRTLSSENIELNNYLTGRDTSESTLEQVSFGVSLKYNLGGGFYSKAGLSINRWNESYSYNIVRDTIKNSVEVPDVILIDFSGSTITEYTEAFQTIYNTIDWVRYNRLTQIDLPITLGYEHRMRRWSLFGEVSGIFNLRQKFNGYLNTEEGIGTENPEIFKNSIGLNFGLNAGLGYGITPRLRARLSARYYQSLGSVLLPSTEIEQKYSSVGLRLGLGYLF